MGKLPEKEFRIMIVKMIKTLENKMEKMQESINKDLEELKNIHTETNSTITEIKNTLEASKNTQKTVEKRSSQPRQSRWYDHSPRTRYPQVRCMILNAWGWCTGTTQRDGTGREEGGRFRMGNTCITVADSC